MRLPSKTSALPLLVVGGAGSSKLSGSSVKEAADLDRSSLGKFHQKEHISLSLKQVEMMIASLFSADSCINNISEIKEHATKNPELFRQAVLKMIEKADAVENTWDKAIEIAEILSLPKSSRNSSQVSFADELKMEINTQRFIRDLTWHVNNAGFGTEKFSIEGLNFSRFALPTDPSVTHKALMKIVSPDGPFGSFGLELALKLTADTRIEDLHEKFHAYKTALAESLMGERIDYRPSTDNHAQNDIRHVISTKVPVRNPAYNTLIQLFMMPNSLLPNDQVKKVFLEEAKIHYSEFVNNLAPNLADDFPLIKLKPTQNLVKNMVSLIQKHFQHNGLAGELPSLLNELAAGSAGRLALALPKKFQDILTGSVKKA